MPNIERKSERLALHKTITLSLSENRLIMQVYGANEIHYLRENNYEQPTGVKFTRENKRSV